jgi:glycosyltransferase involved in cell wall biosynthesis
VDGLLPEATIGAVDEPIRILRVIARLNVGGPALHVSYLTRFLAERGYETTLVAGSVGEGEGSMEYVADELGVQPLFIPELQREIAPYIDAASVRKLRELIRKVRPHVLHTHTAKAGALGRTAAALAGSARPPVVVHTFHGHVLRGYFSPFSTRVFSTVERELARQTDALVAVSPQVRDDLVQLGVAPAKRISVIRLGLDLDRRVAAPADARQTQRLELGLPDDRFVVTWLGRMTEIKRADDLLRAFALVRGSGIDAALLLVGDGPLRAALEALAAELGIAEDCRFTGYREDVGPIYAASDAVALTSANEGTPVSVIEAQAAGLPAVATDVGGVRDVVADGRTGFLAPAGDVSAIAERLVDLASRPDLRRELGEAGREHVRDRYSVPRLLDDVDRLYRTLLQVEQPSRRFVVGPLSEPLPLTLPPHRPRAKTDSPLRVALVSQYFPPEVGATQSRMQAFAEYLADRGHEVTVITEFPNHPLGVIPPRFRRHLLVDDRSNSYRVLRVWVRAAPEKTQATRMAFYLSYMGLACATAPLLGPVDVVLATTPPLFAGLAGLALAGLKGAPLVLDVRDLWPAAAVSLNQISSGMTLHAAEALERMLYRGADEVVAVTRPFCDHVDRMRGRGRAAHIPNGTLDHFFADGETRSRRSLGLPDDRFLVTFAGTLGIAQALPTVLDAAERTDGAAAFALIGEGPLKEMLMTAAEERELANVRFMPQVPTHEIVPFLASSDALLVSLSGHPTFRDFVPSKMIDFMAVGRPVILSAAGESARLLELAGAGMVVPPEDAEALSGAVRWLAGHPDEAGEMGRRGREFARGRLRSAQAARLEQVLLDAAASRGRGRS